MSLGIFGSRDVSTASSGIARTRPLEIPLQCSKSGTLYLTCCANCVAPCLTPRSVLSRSQSAIHRLIASAYALDMAHTATRLVTYTPAKGNTYWHETSSRPARSLESVVLPNGVKERVVVDLEEFLGGAKWYAERGE